MPEHRVELQLIAGPCLMRGHRPRHCVEGEVAGPVRSIACGRRRIQRQYKLCLLGGVAQRLRGEHVRNRHLRGLGRCGETQDRRIIGQRDEVLGHDDLFDRLQPRLIERKDGVAGDLRLLQLAEHIAVVGGGPCMLLGDLCGKWRHLRLNFDEDGVGLGLKLRWRKIDATLFEAKCVLLGRYSGVGLGLGHQSGADPGVVVGQLLLQTGEGFPPAGQFVLDEELLHGVDVALVAPKFGLHLAGRGIDHAGLCHLFHHALLQNVGEWLEPRLDARVLAQPDGGGRSPVRRHLVVEQGVQAGENRLTGVEELHVVVEFVVVLAELQIEGLLENLQVFTHIFVPLLRFNFLQLRKDVLKFLALGDLAGTGRIGDQGIVDRQPLRRGPLRRVLHLHVEEHLGVLVAAGNPGGFRRGNRSRGLWSGGVWSRRVWSSGSGRLYSSGRLRSTDRGRGHQASGKNQQRNGGAAHQHISRKGNTTSIRPSPHLEVV